MKKVLILLLILLNLSITINIVSLEQIGPAGISGKLLSVDDITNIIYVVSENNNIYKVNQEINSWTELFISFQNGENITSIATNNNTIFIGTTNHIYRSLDGGINWNISDSGINHLYYDFAGNITIYKPDPNIIFSLVCANIWYRSTDNGTTWHIMNNAGTQHLSYDYDSDFVLLINNFKMYKSYNKGASWIEQEYSELSDFNILSLAVIDDSTYIVGGINYDDITEKLFITYDSGSSWENVSYQFDFNFPTDLKKINGDIYLNVASAESETEVSGVWKFDNINHTWIRLGNSFSRENSGIYIDSYDDNVVLLSLYNGLFIFNINDNTTRNLVPNNIYELSIRLCSDDNLLPDHNFCRSASLYSFQNNEWSRVDSVYSIFEMAQSPFETSFCVSLTVRKGIYLSHDNGNTWISSNNGISPNDRQLINNVHFLSNNIILISGYEKKLDHFNSKSFIYRSIDQGENWSKIMEVDNSSILEGISLEDVIKIGDTFYACMHCGIKKSEDFGLTWENVFTLENRLFMQLKYDSESGYFYMKTLNLNTNISKTELIRTNDFISWSDCAQTFSEGEKIIDFDLSPNDSGTILCSTNSRYDNSNPKLIISSDFGETWNECDLEGMHKNILDIAFIQGINDIIICPQYSSMYKLNISELDILNDNINPLNNYTLSNYPNPFHSISKRGSGTTISFDLPKSGNVDLTIYNIKGQKVKTLTNEKYPKGKHSLIWNGKNDKNQDVSSGVYFYKLNVDGKDVNVKKCLLMK